MDFRRITQYITKEQIKDIFKNLFMRLKQIKICYFDEKEAWKNRLKEEENLGKDCYVNKRHCCLIDDFPAGEFCPGVKGPSG